MTAPDAALGAALNRTDPADASAATVPATSDRAHRAGTSLIKRALDVTIATISLVALSPLIGLAMAAVRLTSRGPAVFRQERVGLDGAPFTIYKLRSMHVGRDDSHHREHAIRLIVVPDAPPTENGTYKIDDPRVTPVGRFIRATSIDELPQLLNVIKGDMSLVGPRPMLEWEFEHVSGEHRRRVDVRPGMTGRWQVSGRSDLSTAEMLDLDVAYLDGWSVAADLAILVKTPFSLVSR